MATRDRSNLPIQLTDSVNSAVTFRYIVCGLADQEIG